MAFQSADGAGYASLSGTVEVVTDLGARKRLWRDDWTRYFPDGPTEGYVLLKVTPTRIEVLDFAHEVAPPPFGAVPAALERSADTWRMATDA